MNKNTKQVLIWRNDLKVRKGKFGAMIAHASMAFLTRKIDYDTCGYYKWTSNSEEVINWLKNSFKKVVVYVDNEEELVAIHEKALAAGLISHLVEDNGVTEFNGVKTKTAVAIGPHSDDKFEGITDHLKLL
jgi:PTH2 family peptidyl-tRNA hydrolase